MKLSSDAWSVGRFSAVWSFLDSGTLRGQLVDLHSSPSTSRWFYKFFSAESLRSVGRSWVHTGWGFSTDPLIFDSTCLSVICPSQEDFSLCGLKISREAWRRTQDTFKKVPWTLYDNSIEVTKTTYCRNDTDDKNVCSVVNLNWV